MRVSPRRSAAVRSAVFFVALLLVLLGGCAGSGAFESFVDRVHAALEAARPAMVDSFLVSVQSYPLVECCTHAHFLYRGAAASVSVPGDHNNWDADDLPMQRLSTTDLWFATCTFEADARLEYKLAVDGTWMLDPRNPRTVAGGYGLNSDLPMPRYLPPGEIIRDPSVPRGRLSDTSFASAALGDSRVLRVYTPAGYDTMTAACCLLLVHDGADYLTFAQADIILDNLIARRRIPPVIAVFVPPVDRTAEYIGEQISRFGDFIANELLPFIDGRYRTRRDPAARAVLGASNGGNISLYLAARCPDQFGNVGAQSSNITPPVGQLLARRSRPSLRIYLDLGTYDIPGLIPLVRGLEPALRAHGDDLLYQEYHEGHSWATWRAHVDDALVFFFGPRPVLRAW